MNSEDIVTLDFGSTIENTEVGDWYRGIVNAVEDYGLFITLARQPDGGDLSGLAHENQFAGLHRPVDYEEGQDVVVERLPGGDRGNLSLRLVSSPEGDLLVDKPLEEYGEIIERRPLEEQAVGIDDEPAQHVHLPGGPVVCVIKVDEETLLDVIRGLPRDKAEQLFEAVTGDD